MPADGLSTGGLSTGGAGTGAESTGAKIAGTQNTGGLNTDWPATIEAALTRRKSEQTFRSRRPVRILDSTHIQIDNRRLVNFASNNYLGLTHHPRVMAAFKSATSLFGVGSGAAALVSGHTEAHTSTERKLAQWKNTESALLLSSGFAANLAAVQTLAAIAGPDRVRFLIDKLAHASLIDAVRSVGPGFRVFPHNHLAKLRRLLEQADTGVLQVVVTESIFSMDGDAADLAGIAELKKQFPFLLLLDEAHGSGVYGPGGSGYAADLGLTAAVDLTVVTLSKAIGCAGGAICASHNLCQAIVNFGRPYIYSTAIPPAIAAAVEAAIDVMRDEPNRQQRVRTLAERVRREALNQPGDSPIIPIILGDETDALNLARKLLEDGIFTVAVRPPTVPRGSSRLRITLCSDHTDEEVTRLIQALKESRG
jgi:8-amino-7-oxononanoate synthase